MKKKKRKKWIANGYLRFIPKIGFSHYSFKILHNISSCSSYVNFSKFIQQNYNILEQQQKMDLF
ncbi:MAG: hypothetical protein AB2693_29950 [Candidatus Thiodiazotropha sp.]